MPGQPISDEMARQMRAAWFRYLDIIEPFRASLYRYCRRMTRDLWDAEDLLQDTLLRGFGAIGRGDLNGGPGGPVRNARAYLFRIATNLWIDQMRRTGNQLELETTPNTPQIGSTRDAAAALLTYTAPQERAALVLKDIFDFTLEEIAEMLSTTVGAIKSALHRGRAHLQPAMTASRPRFRSPSKELLDRFVEAFNARDVKRVTDLLLENVTLEVPGVGGERGKKMIWITSSMELPTPNLLAREQTPMNPEVVHYNGEWILLIWCGPRSDGLLADVNRFEEQDGHIARIWEYYYCPDTIAELAAEFGAKPILHGYHQEPDVLSNMIASTMLPWRERSGA